MSLDTKALFAQHFGAAIQEEAERTSVPQDQWRRTGRASKKYPDKEGPEFWLDEGPIMLDGYIEWRRKYRLPIWTTPEGVPAIELDITSKSPGAGLPPIRGFIDRIFVDPKTGALVIVDLKTGKQPGARQLGIYKYLVEQQWPDLHADLGAFYMARPQKMSDLIDLTRYTRDYVVDYILAPYVRGVQARAFSPVPSSFCGTCTVRDFCPEFGDRADEIPPFDRDAT